LNRAGVPLLEIVSEPDIRTAEEARAYAESLRDILKYLGVNSGDMQKGVMRIEPNVSVRRKGDPKFGTRTEIKNLNSFRALERGIDYEIQRQIKILETGGRVRQETVGWDENQQVTYIQRVKEDEDDYRYFPEPDLPPLVIDTEWIESVQASLPELPQAKCQRFQDQYELTPYTAQVLTTDRAVADYFESVVVVTPQVSPKTVANWIAGELYALMNDAGVEITSVKISPAALGALLGLARDQTVNQQTAKTILADMFVSGQSPHEIVKNRGLNQISDQEQIATLVAQVLENNLEQVVAYREGKLSLSNWFFGQVMRATSGKANPQVVRAELDRQLANLTGP
jgi:aspartyl-tRNA(Asn)/glutamyl-tRNA(Gln) amidotransferase subunit B